MIPEDFHVHSSYSDGLDHPETVVRAALALGMTYLGFSDHGYAAYDGECCIPREKLAEHRQTIRALSEKYRDRIEICCGVEQDLYSDAPTEGYDYVIGSVHYLYLDGRYYDIDYKVETLRELTERFFGGDIYGLTAAYFQAVGEVYERTGCDLIGHFDLICKLNERYSLFDPQHPRYIEAWQKAAERLLKSGKPFEINTGGISRGYTTAAYPALDIRRYLADRGARFVLSSDSHSADTLLYGFAREEALAGEMGIPLTRFRWK